MITPEFFTPGATKTASPPSATVMVPWLMIAASGWPAMLKLYFPATKSSLRILEDVAISEPTLILAAAPKAMPAGLLIATIPIALKLPLIIDAPPPPVTRFSAVQLASCCLMTTFSPAAMLKDFQSITTLGVFWMMMTLVGLVTIFAAPVATTPSCGKAQAVPDDSTGRVTSTLHSAVVSRSPCVSLATAGRRNRADDVASAAVRTPRLEGSDSARMERRTGFFLPLGRSEWLVIARVP